MPSYVGDAVALLKESYTLVQRNSHVLLALSDKAFVSGARCIGFFLFDSSSTTGFTLHASLLTVLHVVYAIFRLGSGKTMVSILMWISMDMWI